LNHLALVISRPAAIIVDKPPFGLAEANLLAKAINQTLGIAEIGE
jgi:hypothetical protein